MNLLCSLAQNDGATGLGIGILILIIIGGLLGLFLLIFSIWMFFDALINQPTAVEKLLWAALIFFFSPIAPLVYYFIARDKEGIPPEHPYPPSRT